MRCRLIFTLLVWVTQVPSLAPIVRKHKYDAELVEYWIETKTHGKDIRIDENAIEDIDEEEACDSLGKFVIVRLRT